MFYSAKLVESIQPLADTGSVYQQKVVTGLQHAILAAHETIVPSHGLPVIGCTDLETDLSIPIRSQTRPRLFVSCQNSHEPYTGSYCILLFRPEDHYPSSFLESRSHLFVATFSLSGMEKSHITPSGAEWAISPCLIGIGSGLEAEAELLMSIHEHSQYHTSREEHERQYFTINVDQVIGISDPGFQDLDSIEDIEICLQRVSHALAVESCTNIQWHSYAENDPEDKLPGRYKIIGTKNDLTAGRLTLEDAPFVDPNGNGKILTLNPVMLREQHNIH